MQGRIIYAVSALLENGSMTKRNVPFVIKKERRPFGRIHLRIHSLKRYLFAPLFVENARKTATMYSEKLYEFFSAFRLDGHKNLLF